MKLLAVVPDHNDTSTTNDLEIENLTSMHVSLPISILL